MIVVRQVFQVEWGKSKDFVATFVQCREIFRRIAGSKVRVRLMTDLSGPFSTVVQEIEVESLVEWERVRDALAADPELQQASSGFPRFTGGYQEFYTLVATIEP